MSKAQLQQTDILLHVPLSGTETRLQTYDNYARLALQQSSAVRDESTGQTNLRNK